MAEQNQQQIKVQTARATVARGRSIDVPVPGKSVVVGTNAENKPIMRCVTRKYIAGQEVELPLDEIVTLRASGYLVDPDKIAPPTAEGPSFGSNEPGQVRAA